MEAGADVGDNEGGGFSVLDPEEDACEDTGDSDGDIFLVNLVVFLDAELPC